MKKLREELKKKDFEVEVSMRAIPVLLELF